MRAQVVELYAAYERDSAEFKRIKKALKNKYTLDELRKVRGCCYTARL